MKDRYMTMRLPAEIEGALRREADLNTRTLAAQILHMVKTALPGNVGPQQPLPDGAILGMWPDTNMPLQVIDFARKIERAHFIGRGK